MTAREHFAAWAAAQGIFDPNGARAAWDAVTGWLAQGGALGSAPGAPEAPVVLAAPVAPAAPGATAVQDDRVLGAALAQLCALAYGNLARVRPCVQPAQIAAARIGDFTRADDANGPALHWRLRRCGWAVEGEAVLRGVLLDAWRTCARYGRSSAPAADAPLLAPRGGRPWGARAVRRAVQAAEAQAAEAHGAPEAREAPEVHEVPTAREEHEELEVPVPLVAVQ